MNKEIPERSRESKEPEEEPTIGPGMENYPGARIIEALNIPTGSILSSFSQGVIHDALIKTLPADALTEIPMTWESLFEANNHSATLSHHDNRGSNAASDSVIDSKIVAQNKGSTKHEEENVANSKINVKLYCYFLIFSFDLDDKQVSKHPSSAQGPAGMCYCMNQSCKCLIGYC